MKPIQQAEIFIWDYRRSNAWRLFGLNNPDKELQSRKVFGAKTEYGAGKNAKNPSRVGQVLEKGLSSWELPIRISMTYFIGQIILRLQSNLKRS